MRTIGLSSLCASAALAITTMSTQIGCVDLDAAQGCVADAECREGRICQQGRCLTPVVRLLDEEPNDDGPGEGEEQPEVVENSETPENSENSEATSCEEDGSCISNCLEISTEEIAFGPVPIGRDRVEQVVLRNCGDEGPLLVEGIELSDERAATISAWSLGVPPYELEPGATSFVEVTFAPTEPRDYVGTLIVSHRGSRPRFVPWSGLGVEPDPNNRCPIAVAQGQLEGDDAKPGKELKDVPLGVILLDGELSYDLDGEISRYEWRLIREPFGSRAEIEAEGDGVNARLALDLPGQYIARLEVFDDDGAPSCEPAEVIIETAPSDP